MKGKIILRVFSGLGNQQFQYAFAKTLSLKYNKELIIDNSNFLKRYFSDTMSFSKIFFRLSDCNLENEKFTNVFVRELIGVLYKFRGCKKAYELLQKIKIVKKVFPVLMCDTDFSINKLNNNNIIILSGFFQKHSLFEEYSEEIRKGLAYKAPLSKSARTYLKQIKMHSVVSIHIRRGDYLQFPDVYSLVGLNYYKNAVQYIREQTNIDKLVVFSNDLNWVKENMKFAIDCIYIEDDNQRTDIEDQFLMANCNHHIVANSTYSW